MESLWIGPTYRRPPVELLTQSGERLPLALDTRDDASHQALDRRGWVAMMAGYQVAGLVDGDLLRPVSLPDAWRIAPAADPELVLVRRYSGGSRGGGEPGTIALVDKVGRVQRSVSADVWGAEGELSDGRIATRHALLTWAGEQQPLPVDGEAVAVLSGRYLVIADRPAATVHVVDTLTTRTSAAQVPAGAFPMSPVFDRDASQLAMSPYSSGEPAVIVRGTEIWLLDIGSARCQLAWIDQDRLLLAGPQTVSSIDVVTGASEALTGLPRGAVPRINITGRFDPEQLRAALRPAFQGPISRTMRDDLLAHLGDQVAERWSFADLPAELIDALMNEMNDEFVPALRLRSFSAADPESIGASRFGGRPDLPAGFEWPTYDGRPMMFVGQFRVDEINAALPKAMALDRGLVVVFAAIEADGGYPVADDAVRVEIVPTDGLRPLSWPALLPEELRLESAVALAEPMLTPPHDLDDDDEDAFYDLMEELLRGRPRHQMFGNLATIHGHPSPPDGHRLFLSFDGDPFVCGPHFGDGGTLLIWTPAPAGPVSDFGPCIIHLDTG